MTIPKPAMIRDGRVVQQGGVPYCPELLLELLLELLKQFPPICHIFYLFSGKESLKVVGIGSTGGLVFDSLATSEMIEELFEANPELKMKQVLWKMRR